MAHNLIIGAIEGYKFDQIAPFFLTLRSVKYNGDIVIFHRNIDAGSRQKITELGARLIELPPKGLRNPMSGRMHTGQGKFGDVLSLGLRAIANAPVSRAKKEAWALGFARRFFHIANLRFLVAGHYLREHLASYDSVMISDIRDVLFQADPFDFEGVDRLTTFLESPHLTLETSEHYRNWFESAFGATELDRFFNARLSCCAITVGPAAAMLLYLNGMTRLIAGNYTREPYLFGMDSAAHNYICLHQSVPGLTLRENLDGPVAHLGSAEREAIRFDHAGRLVNKAGVVIPTVHQYDKHPDVMAALLPCG